MSSSVMLNHWECVLQSEDSSTVLPKMGRLTVFFPTYLSLLFQVHIGPFKRIYGRIHQHNSAQLNAVCVHAKVMTIKLSKIFRGKQAEIKLGGSFFLCQTRMLYFYDVSYLIIPVIMQITFLLHFTFYRSKILLFALR